MSRHIQDVLARPSKIQGSIMCCPPHAADRLDTSYKLPSCMPNLERFAPNMRAHPTDVLTRAHKVASRDCNFLAGISIGLRMQAEGIT